MEKIEIPPFLEYVDESFVQTAEKLKEINIISSKSQMILIDEIFLINESRKELILAAKVENSERFQLNDIKNMLSFAFAFTRIVFVDFSKCKIKEFPKSCFYRSNIKEVVIPDICETICRSCFEKCRNLSNVVITENSRLQTIEDEAFLFSSIKKLYIPPQVKSIGLKCFYNSKIKSL